MATCGKRAAALVLAAVLLGLGSVRADETPSKEGTGGADSTCLFPFGTRAPGRPGAKTTKAVDAGLAWLAAHQGPKGVWHAADIGWCRDKKLEAELAGRGKPQYDPGVTGMAVCAFLSAGHTHEVGPYAQTIGRALHALVGMQDPDGCIGPRTSQHYVYNHAFGALALVEAYGMTSDPRLRSSARQALMFSEKARNPYFAWRYGVKAGDNDTSITGCMTVPFVAALRVNRAAEAAGEEPPFPPYDELYEGVRAWLDKVTDPDYGRTGYIQRGGAPARPMELIDEFPGDLSESCTGIGVYLRAVLPGGDRDVDAAILQKGTQVLRSCLPRWTPGGGNIDLYYWYYGSLAMAAVGGDAADTWRKALETALVGGQRSDTDVCAYLGSWDTDTPWGPEGGRSYATAMAVLSLRAAERFPPLPDDRSDLIDALDASSSSPDLVACLLRALSVYRTPKAGPAVLPHARSKAPHVRAAAAAALARCEPSRDAVEALGRMLNDDMPAVRREAAAGLTLVGSRASPAGEAIVRAIDDDDAEVRRHALRALGGLADAASAAEGVRSRLADPAPRVRVAAATLLRRLEPTDAEAEKVLLAGLRGKEATLRAEAAAGLAESATLTDDAREALEGTLDDDSPRVQVAAARGLVGAGADPAALLDIMEPCLESSDRETRRLALQLAERLGPRAGAVADPVAAAALSGATPVRVAALRALAAMGPGVPGTVAVLFAVRDRGPLPVRDAARAALDGLGADEDQLVAALLPSLGSTWKEIVSGAVLGLSEQGKAAVAPLTALLGRGNLAEKTAALRALAAMGPAAASAVSDVEKLIDAESSTTVVAEAIRFLGAMCRRARCAVERLVTLAESGAPVVRYAAIDALGSIGASDRRAVEALGGIATMRKKEDRKARIAALRALARLGPDAEPALSALRLALSSNDAPVRAAAVDGMAGVGKPAVEYLLEAIEDRDAAYAAAAMEALGKMGRDAKKAVRPLAELLPKGARMGSWDAARALAGIGKPSVRTLVKLLKEGNGETRRQAAWALGAIGKDARSAVSTLKRALKDSQPAVRQAAQEALDRIHGE